MEFHRFKAITSKSVIRNADGADNLSTIIYTSVYAVLSVVTSVVQILAYTTTNWSSSLARSTSYFTAYRYFNLATTTWFVALGRVAFIFNTILYSQSLTHRLQYV
jgi:hypothetical protein